MKFPVSLAGGEVQLPASRITRFNRDRLPALICSDNKRQATVFIGNRKFCFMKHLDLKQGKMRLLRVILSGWWLGV